MRVLVTGGTGLLSGPLVDNLRQIGAEVVVFNRGASRNSAGGLTGDRTDYSRFVWSVRTHGPWDCLIDMIGGVPGDAKSLIQAARGYVPHVIFCSTTTVYGRPFLTVPVVEDGAILAPPSPYGENKLACERLLRDAEERGDFSVTIIRPAHVYGERSLMLHSLGTRTSHLDRLRLGRRVVVHDDGESRWSSLWAADCAKGIAAAAFVLKARGQTYHLAGSETFTWNNYQHLVASCLGGPKPDLLHVPSERLALLAPKRAMQCLRTLRYPGVYNCCKAARDLGFWPTVSPSVGFFRNAQFLSQNGLVESWADDEEYEEVVTRAAG